MDAGNLHLVKAEQLSSLFKWDRAFSVVVADGLASVRQTL